MKIRTAIFGGSGYGGSELLRILLFHPNAEIALVTANEHAGKRVSDVHKNLLGLTDLVFETAPEDLSSLDVDIAFFALPHGQAMDLAPKLAKGVKAIDLGNALTQTKGLAQQGRPDTVQGQKFAIPGLSQD